MERAKNAILAKNTLGNDFFGGWLQEDLQLFSEYHYLTGPSAGMITDYFGVRTPAYFVPWAAHLSGTVIQEPPIPDDGVRAEAIEYYAVLNSLKDCNDSYTIIELGASYAPWAVLGTAIAARKKIPHISATAVEASSFFMQSIFANFNANEILNGYNSNNIFVEIRAIHGCVGISQGNAFFPIVTDFNQNGGQGSTGDINIDYVGREVRNETVSFVKIDEIFGDRKIIDFLHIDIQGFELDILKSNISLIKQKVRSFFIGTHSRYIEGEIIYLLHKTGFLLVRERPCQFTYRQDLADLSGMTIRDGGQYWINPLLHVP